MKEGRRGFLKGLGKLMAAAPLVAIPVTAAEVPIETKEPKTAFRFQCDCGGVVLAPMPSEPGLVRMECPQCHAVQAMRWKGDHWTIASWGGVVDSFTPDKLTAKPEALIGGAYVPGKAYKIDVKKRKSKAR